MAEQIKTPICVRIEHPDEPTYQPSVFNSVLATECNGCRKVHSDVHLILRDKKIASQLGPDVLKSYVDSIVSTRYDKSVDTNLSDDQIMETILDRRVTDATDVYQMTKAMESKIDDIIKSRDSYRSYKEKQDKRLKELKDTFGIKS